MKIIASILITLILAGVGDEPCENDWVLVKNKNSIKIYSRKYTGSDIKEIKANTNVNASVASLTKLLTDVDAFPEWMPNVKSAEVLKRVSENEIYYYVEVKIPWPFSNRDNVMHIKVLDSAEKEDVSIIIESDPDYIPEKEGLVRIPKASGMWKFTPNEDGTTNVFLKYLADPGGNVPVWIINMFVADVPYKTLTRLKETITKNQDISGGESSN